MVCHTVQSSQPSCDFFNVRNAGSWLDRCKSLRMNRISFDCRGELQHVKVSGSGLLKHFDVLLMLPNMPITGSDMQALCEKHEETWRNRARLFLGPPPLNGIQKCQFQDSTHHKRWIEVFLLISLRKLADWTRTVRGARTKRGKGRDWNLQHWWGSTMCAQGLQAASLAALSIHLFLFIRLLTNRSNVFCSSHNAQKGEREMLRSYPAPWPSSLFL